MSQVNCFVRLDKEKLRLDRNIDMFRNRNVKENFLAADKYERECN